MFSRILRLLGNPSEVRSVAAVVVGVLATVLDPHSLAVVTAVVDGFAGLVVALDTLNQGHLAALDLKHEHHMAEVDSRTREAQARADEFTAQLKVLQAQKPQATS